MFQQIVRAPDSQIDLLLVLVADATFGRAGSIIVAAASSDRLAQISENVNLSHSCDSEADYCLNYIKILPLSDDSDRITHLLAIVHEIPLGAYERHIAQHLLGKSQQHLTTIGSLQSQPSRVLCPPGGGVASAPSSEQPQQTQSQRQILHDNGDSTAKSSEKCMPGIFLS